jgi:hypothetical protein
MIKKTIHNEQLVLNMVKPSKALQKKGLKHGVRSIKTEEAAEAMSQDGTIDTDDIFWEDDDEWNIKNHCLRTTVKALILLRCIPQKKSDSTPIKNWLRGLQWAALIADLIGAVVAVITFSGVTYCCGESILNQGNLHLDWHFIIRVLTYLYLALVVLEIYPVVRKGFPFNLVNPLFGFVVTVAMFFDDSKVEALAMWSLETFSVICLFVILRLKICQRNTLAMEVVRVGKLTKEDPETPDKDLKEHRRQYYQLKKEQESEGGLLLFLRLGCYLNVGLVLIVLALIIVISQSGGLCVNGDKILNPFDPHQKDNCPSCDEVDGFCEVCTQEVRECYFPYS